jgi:signal peptidase I
MLAAGFLLSMLLTKLVTFSPFLVEGPSMFPTLRDGEVFVLDEGAYSGAVPQRGDIVVFADTRKPDYLYIKRVIGLPGERLHVTSNGVFVEENGTKKELPESYLVHAADQNRNYSLKGYEDEIFAVPKDKYFVMGDNRLHSLDSRSFAYPFILQDAIKGKYLFSLIY